MLHRFTAKRYRNLDVDDLELARLNLVVGPNNAGKSNFHKAIGFGADLLDTNFLVALQKHGGGDVLDRASPVPGDVELAWTFSSASGANPMTYELAFRIDKADKYPAGFYITKERLRDESRVGFFEGHTKTVGKGDFTVKDATGELKTSTVDLSPQDTVFDQNAAVFTQRGGSELFSTFETTKSVLKSYFGGFRWYASAEINPSEVASGARRDVSVKQLDPAGRELANVLRYLEQGDGLDEYTRILGQVLPDLRRVNSIDAGDKHVGVRLDIEGRKFRLDEMSHGTVKAMLLALLMSAPVRMSLLALDEPEMNLHPAWLRILGRWLLDCRSADQLIISTHSPDLLDAFTEGFREGSVALFVFEWPQRELRRVEPKRLDVFFNEGWELGDLYRVGEPKLGGWPW